MKKVYFDNAATTQTDKDVAATVLEYMTNTFGNPGSVHAFGREARKAVDIAREQVAKLIGAQPNEIFYTSGGTESAETMLSVTLSSSARFGRLPIIFFGSVLILYCIPGASSQIID